MTREEEIERASVHHLNQYDYSYEEGEHLDFYIKGFTEGAKWADEHPNLEILWHDAVEEPQCEYEFICQDTLGNVWLTDHKANETGWEERVIRECIIRWAYVKDLLPKGGKK